jgi:LuxR family transcriptional regulator, maltose regulon positive regulatory protein
MARSRRTRSSGVGLAADPRPADELPPLAEAKLAAPRQRAGMVLRPNIMRALDAGADAALTLVAAPAGYGKTTAVRAWCASSETALAWVTLDAGDNDPARLWTYVATAVDRVRDGLGRRALHRLGVSGMPIETAVDELMNGIAAFGHELALVLDDFHTVTDGQCLASVEHSLERLPATARLIIITRVDPALELARLRAGGALVELRASDLSFTAAEARELLVARGGLQLEAEDIEVLLKRTEGWPAALYLAALWLGKVEDQRRAVQEFGGDLRYVAEYLTHEVLASLDPDERSFLLQAAVLGRFTAELCDGVLGRSDSAAVLGELEHSNMFVGRLERQEWFRVHSLFAQFAAARLAAVQPGAAVQIHQRAAGWLRSRGMVIEAIEHASAAGDDNMVAELLSEFHLALIRRGSAATLLRWVRTLPDELLVDHPELAAAAATAATMIGQRAHERRRLLQLADRARVERPEHFGLYADAVMAMARAAAADIGVSKAVLEGRRAVELAQRGADEVFVAAFASLARALYFAGQLDEAWVAASRAVEHPDALRRAPGYALAQSMLALIAADRGWLTSARGHAEKARAIVGGITSSRSWLGANAAVALGAVLAGEGDLAGAEREFSYAERFFRDEVATVYHARLLVRLADVRCRRGRSMKPTRRCAEPARSLPSSPIAAPSRRSRPRSRRTLTGRRAKRARGRSSNHRVKRSWLSCGCSRPTCRRVGSQRSCFFQRIRSGRIRGRSIASLESIRGSRPSLGRMRLVFWGKRNHPGDLRALVQDRDRVCQSLVMRSRTYRLEVEGELSDQAGWAFEGMRLRHVHGNTVLVGPVRDQAALHGLLRRFSDLGLTLVSVNAIEGGSEN